MYSGYITIVQIVQNKQSVDLFVQDYTVSPPSYGMS